MLEGNAQMGGANVVGYSKHCLLENGPGSRTRSVDVLAIVGDGQAGSHPTTTGG
jgi:hypothetical protein